MPRVLPWAHDAIASTATKRPSKPVAAQAAQPKKRPRVQDDSASDGEDPEPTLHKKDKRKDWMNSSPISSPPPEPPAETFMQEGLDYDDKFRMVEDEFLTIAKQFTVHLHKAEYDRQRKAAKSKNAETISSISRPVTQKMPDHTRRKTESVKRSEFQRNTLQGLFGKKAKADDLDSSEDDALPYVGTSLHGLMDSPRKKAVSLANIGTMAKTTRAAAGFQKSAVYSRQEQRKFSKSPQSKTATQRVIKDSHDITESSDEDDDLDAPIPVPKLARPSPYRPSTEISKPMQKSEFLSHVEEWAESIPTSISTKPSLSRTATQSSTSSSRAKDLKAEAEVTDNIRNSQNASGMRKRLALARAQKAEQEKRNQKKKHLDIIPMFL